VSCEEAGAAFQFRFLCSSSSTLRMIEKNVYPSLADTFLKTGASENVEEIGEKCRH
jgi:hypothetical protein